jgi:hypothetical protein
MVKTPLLKVVVKPGEGENQAGDEDHKDGV